MAFSYSGNGDPEAKQEYKMMEDGGEYEFDISNAEERTSRAGNQMLVLDLQPTDPEFSGKTIKQYIVVNEYWDNNIAKLRASAGKDHGSPASFEASQVIGWRVNAKVKHEEYEKDDGTEAISEKVAYFVVNSVQSTQTPPPSGTKDQVPF